MGAQGSAKVQHRQSFGLKWAMAALSRTEMIGIWQTVEMKMAGQSKVRVLIILMSKLFLLNNFCALMSKLFVWISWFAGNS